RPAVTFSQVRGIITPLAFQTQLKGGSLEQYEEAFSITDGFARTDRLGAAGGRYRWDLDCRNSRQKRSPDADPYAHVQGWRTNGKDGHRPGWSFRYYRR